MSIKTINANYTSLSAASRKVINELIETMLANDAADAAPLHRAKHGLSNKPGVTEDAEVAPKRSRGRPSKEEVAAREAAEAEEAKPARRSRRAEAVEEKPRRKADKVEAKPAAKVKPAAAPAGDVYAGINPVGKTKTERAAYVTAAIKKVEKFVASDRDWHEAHALATKKGVTVAFGRGKPSDAGNKRKIAIAMINAGKL